MFSIQHFPGKEYSYNLLVKQANKQMPEWLDKNFVICAKLI